MQPILRWLRCFVIISQFTIDLINILYDLKSQVAESGDRAVLRSKAGIVGSNLAEGTNVLPLCFLCVV
jgi:hypothetical protein